LSPTSRRPPLPRNTAAVFRWILGLAASGLIALLVIAGSDGLFKRAVPLEQRLVAHNDAIRKKAQQELLGTSQETKRELVAQLIPSLSAADPFVRKWAAIALALLGPASQDALPALLHGVSDPEKEVAQASRVALSEIGTPAPQQFPMLLRDVKNPHEAVRCEAAIGLAKLGAAAQEAIPFFVEEMKTGSPLPDCFVSAAAALIGAHAQATSSVLALLAHPDPVVRRNGGEVLAALTPLPQDVIDALLKTLAEDTDGGLRKVAAKALGLRETPERGAVPSLTAALRFSRLSEVRLSAIEALKGAAWDEDEKWKVIAKSLRDRDTAVRLAVIQWLAEAGPGARTVAPAILEAVRDSDAQIRLNALTALRHSRWRSPNALPVIARAQRDTDSAVRCLAAEELVEMGASDRVAVSLLANDVKNTAFDSICAAQALAFAGRQNREVVPAVIHLLKDENPEVRRRALHIVMALGARAKDALPAVEQAQRDHIPGSDLALRLLREFLPKPRSEATSRRKRRL
jgi:HEAT repeat protein